MSRQVLDMTNDRLEELFQKTNGNFEEVYQKNSDQDSNLDTRAKQSDLDTLKARVDNLVANPGTPTEGNAELIDIRVGADGDIYPTAGDAIRNQISTLQRMTEDLYKGFDLIITSGKTIYTRINVKAGDQFSIEIISGTGFNISTKNLGTDSAPNVDNIGNVSTDLTFTATSDAKYIRVYGISDGELTIKKLGTKVSDLQSEVEALTTKSRLFQDNIDTLQSSTEEINSDLGFSVGDVRTLNLALNSSQTSVLEYWNTTIDMDLPKGTVITAGLKNYSGQYFRYFRVDFMDSAGDWTTTPPINEIGIFSTITTDKNYVRVRLQIARSSSEWDVDATVLWKSTVEGGLLADVQNIESELASSLQRRIYYVKKDGSGDFTSLVEAISEAVTHYQSIVYLGEGIWDLIEELGTDYVESVSMSQRGVYLKNGIHLIGSSRAIVTCKYSGTNQSTKEWLSAFNAGPGGFTLENIVIESDNIRYAMHDERDSDEDMYKNHYLNCTMTHTNGYYKQCIGGGLGRDGHVIVEGCKFITDSDIAVPLVSYHNSGDGYWEGTDSKNAKSFVEIKGCYFNNKGSIKISDFGKSQKVTDVLVHDNNVGSEIVHGYTELYHPYENMNLIAWNNTIRTDS